MSFVRFHYIHIYSFFILKIGDKAMNQIKVHIDKKRGIISVWNNGKGVPVLLHRDYGIYLPELVFSQFLKNSNYDASIKKYTGGKNGNGAKIANIYSNKFMITTSDSLNQKYNLLIFNKIPISLFISL